MKAVAILAAWMIAAAAQAAEIRPLVKAGIDVGGNTLVTATFEDGDTEEIKANEGFYLGGGATLITDARNVEFQLTLAYKYALIDADNGDIEWTRWPLEALAFYRWQHVRAGVGLAYHINPKLDGDGVVNGLNVKFKNAIGAILQVDWRITETIAVGGRLTLLEYEAKSPASGKSSSNGIGATFSMNF
jgi:hypothetical protein